MGVSDWLIKRAADLADSRLGSEFQETTRALAVRQNEFGFDPFGFHRDSLRFAAVVARFLHRQYFRTEVFGIENVPPGRVLLIANHSGQLPFDGLMIASALLMDAKPPRMARSMIEKFVAGMPFGKSGSTNALRVARVTRTNAVEAEFDDSATEAK